MSYVQNEQKTVTQFFIDGKFFDSYNGLIDEGVHNLESDFREVKRLYVNCMNEKGASTRLF